MYQRDLAFIRKADLIVMAGGGLIKFKRENFWQYVPEIIDVAQEQDIPVFLNAVGVEGFDGSDERCLKLKGALNQPCVKGITVRDDFDLLVRHYLDDEKEWLERVLDPAAFCAHVYGCEGGSGSSVIGLGIARDGLYPDYGLTSATKQFWLDFWKETIQMIEASGYEWQIFGNGLYQDYLFELEVLEYVGKAKEVSRYLAGRPVEGRELADTISGYKGIIASRLHANIVAYSVGVPSIGLVWNEKMLWWGKRIGHPDRFMEVDSFVPEKVIVKLWQAMAEGCRPYGECDKDRLERPLAEFAWKYGTAALQKKKEKKKDSDIKGWEAHLVASALGGKKFQYWGMNCPETVAGKYQDGYRWFEADIKLTTDWKLVCVNGWTKAAFQKLGYKDCDDSHEGIGISYSEFMKGSYYDGHYPVMDFDMLISTFSHYPDTKLILDARSNTPAGIREIADIMKEKICDNPGSHNHFVVRVSSAYDVECLSGLSESNENLELMYDVPDLSGRYSLSDVGGGGGFGAEMDRICSNPCINYLSIRRNLASRELLLWVQRYQKKLCIFSCNSLTEIQRFLQMGAALVGTDYLSVDGLNKLV